ncbi:hypothetical protein J4229_00100 [Candidatus Pacearchaeota archaeon]|nr:hypothetical protein [Candidatus Pacearchaeota archaeon]
MTQNNEGLERSVIALVSADRMYIPISSLDGKLKRMKPKLARAIILPDEKKSFRGERVYARIETESEQKARGIKEGIELFSEKYPQYGKILKGIIEEERVIRETHLYFGMNEGKRLTSDDYLGAMAELGFGEVSARNLYQELIEASRNISRKREEERSIMLDTTL